MKQSAIPSGWHRVTAGNCKEGDRALFEHGYFPVRKGDLGLSCEVFDELIRRNTRRTPKESPEFS